MRDKLFLAFKKSQRHRGIITIILLIILVTVLFLPAMTGWQGIFHDDQGMEEFPRYYFVARNLQRGIIPLWDPQTWCGAIPFYARYYADTYYVLLWPFFLLANLNDLNQAYWFLILLPLYLHYLIGATGMFIFLRRVLRCGYLSSFFGGAAYIFSPAFAYAYVWQQVVTVQAWLPWLLTIYVSAVDKWRFWKLPLAGIVLYFIVTGAAPSLWPFVLFLWGSVIIVVTIYRFNADRKKRELLKPFFIALTIVILGCGLSGVYLFSFFDGTKYTEEHIKLTADTALQETIGSLPPPFLATLFIPDLFDNVIGTFMNSFNPSHNVLYWEANMTGGMAVSLLVLLGAISVFKIQANTSEGKIVRLYTFAFIFLYIFAILCVLGRHTLFYRYLIGNLPGIGQLPRPIRYRLLQCFSAAVLSAVGVRFLIQKDSLYFRIKYLFCFFTGIYLLFSLFIIGWAMITPLKIQDRVEYKWLGNQTMKDFLPEGFFEAGESAGSYSPDSVVKKIGVFFDGASKGEIRYSNTHGRNSLTDGVAAAVYDVPHKGWYEFDVDIPAKSFVWIYQKEGNAKIGYRYYHIEEKKGFNYCNGAWVSHYAVGSIGFYYQEHKTINSLIDKLVKKDTNSKLIIISIIYWIAMASILFTGVYILPYQQWGKFIFILAMFELMCFCVFVFYRGTFTWDVLDTKHLRSVGPKHKILRIAEKLKETAAFPLYRIATSKPFYDNFMRIGCHSALMGYEMHPLESRFKRAIETAYEEPMHYDIYGDQPSPRAKYWRFLNNFSVKYLMNRNPVVKFPQGRTMPLESGLLLHINYEALPRIYTQDRIIFASEQEQLQKIISDDLRRAVYLNFSYKDNLLIEDNIDVEENLNSYFADIQRMNRILTIDMDNPNRIIVDIDMSKSAMLVFTEVWYPGWKAVVDGKLMPIYRVNYCQRGIWLGKGRHNVKLYFSPLAWQLGLGVSLLTISFVISGLILTGFNKKLLRN